MLVRGGGGGGGGAGARAGGGGGMGGREGTACGHVCAHMHQGDWWGRLGQRELGRAVHHDGSPYRVGQWLASGGTAAHTPKPNEAPAGRPITTTIIVRGRQACICHAMPRPRPSAARPQSRAFHGMRDMVAWRQRMRVILERATRKIMNRRLHGAWERWWEVIEDRKMEEQLTTKEQLVVGGVARARACAKVEGGR